MLRLVPICIAALLLFGCAQESRVQPLAAWPEGATVPPGATHLVFRAYSDVLTVSIGGRAVYTFADDEASGRLTIHVIALPARSEAAAIVVQPADVTVGSAFAVAAADLPRALSFAASGPVRDELPDLIVAFALISAGAIAFAASLVRRRGEILPVRYFGLFTLLYGLRLIAESYLPLLLGASLREAAFAESFITYVIPIPGWLIPLSLIGPGWKSTLRAHVALFVLFAPIGIASDIVTGTPGSLATANNVLVISGGVNVLVNLVVLRGRRTREIGIILTGALIFLAFALNSNLAGLGLVPWTYDEETLGFLVFMIMLGYAATRMFVRGEREQIAIENELQTAREIQQSILPREMPDVPGLRFHAAYVPATSVAGDVYDFIGVRAGGCGVLVADVAGHGVPAALIASMVKVAASSQEAHADEPATVLGALNATLRRDVRRAFVTATYLAFDMERNVATVANAGHAAPLLHRDGAFLELGAANVLLGRFAVSRFETTSHDLREGDRIVACTDGIVEARNPRDEQFGEERLREAIANGAGHDAATFTRTLVAAVQAWRGTRAGADDVDDLTVVVVDVAPSS